MHAIALKSNFAVDNTPLNLCFRIISLRRLVEMLETKDLWMLANMWYNQMRRRKVLIGCLQNLLMK